MEQDYRNENRKVFKAKYYGPTNTKGSRIKIINLDTLEAKFFSYNYQFNNTRDNAIYFIENLISYNKVVNYFYDYDTNFWYLISKDTRK
jgi:hypothetical protein